MCLCVYVCARGMYCVYTQSVRLNKEYRVHCFVDFFFLLFLVLPTLFITVGTVKLNRSLCRRFVTNVHTVFDDVVYVLQLISIDFYLFFFTWKSMLTIFI